jgi:hypothetical protein
MPAEAELEDTTSQKRILPLPPHSFCHLHFFGWICLACNEETCSLLGAVINHTPSFSKTLLLASERQKMGRTNNATRDREIVMIKPHYRPSNLRLWRTDPNWYETANNLQFHSWIQINNQCWKLSSKKKKIKNMLL